MQFASFTFVFLFLPITMALYYLTPHRWKQEAGLGISLLFLCSGSWLAALVEILLAAAAYGAGLLLEKQRLRRGLSRLLLFGIIVLQFGALLILRSDWLRSWNTGLFSGKELFPLGLSFFVLQATGYCIDIYRGKCSCETNWRSFGLYLFFYPRLLMGPVMSYHAAQRALQKTNFDIAQIGCGLFRFFVGLAKKLVLADWIVMLFQTTVQADASAYSLLMVWLSVFAKLLALYLELSGYADMALGLGMCYGIRLPESYGKSLYYPSVAAFADQWNRTVVQWFSHYVGTHFRGSNRFFHLMAIVVTWGCIGLWYKCCFPAFLFGICIGVCLWAEHLFWNNRQSSVVRHGLVLLLLSVSTVLLTMSDMTDVWHVLKIMLGGGHLAPTEADADLLRAYGLILVVSAYCASGNWRSLLRFFEDKSWFRMLHIPLTILVGLLLLLIDIVFLLRTGGNVQMQLLL